MSEFERRLIVERTKAGLEAARARGVRLGRTPSVSVTAIDKARTLIGTGMSITEAARQLGIGRSTLYRHMRTKRPFL